MALTNAERQRRYRARRLLRNGPDDELRLGRGGAAECCRRAGVAVHRRPRLIEAKAAKARRG
jgi:hypothetical protein